MAVDPHPPSNGPSPHQTVELDLSAFQGMVARGEPVPQPSGRWQQLAAFRERHAVKEGVLFFVGGFLFDVFTLGRIDDLFTLAQQAVYLTLLAGLLLFEERCRLRGPPMRGIGAKAWTVTEAALHFLFGSLLSTSTLFFFKSASGITSLIFLALMLLLLIANELPMFRRLGPVIRLGLFAFCLIAYLAYLIPILLGFLSPLLFVAAVVLASAPLHILYSRVKVWSGSGSFAFRRAMLPMAGVQVLLLALYFVGAIPPVPLSVQAMGIYHSVEKRDGEYWLTHEADSPVTTLLNEFRPSEGDTVFRARPGEKIHVFARIFAPKGFKDRVFIRFSKKDAKGAWDVRQPIPLTISGGRDAGFRGYAWTANYAPGDWRVLVETADQRTVKVLRFKVETYEGTDEPAMVTDKG